MHPIVEPSNSRSYDRNQLLPALLPNAPATISAPVRLLIICDDGQRLEFWRAALPERHWEITGLASPQWLNQTRLPHYDLAIVDVTAPQLADVLQAIRATHGQIPVLVEASRLPNDLSCVGVLPRYHAMPCVQPDLIRLVKRRFTTSKRVLPLRSLL